MNSDRNPIVRHMNRFMRLLGLSAAFAMISWCATLKSLASFQFPLPHAPIVVIGDLHGDLPILFTILKDHNLIDDTGHWQGGDSQVVLLGDLVDRGSDSRYLMDYVMRLEQEAQTAGGHVFTLLGNHELMQAAGNFGFSERSEIAAFSGYRRHVSQFTTPRDPPVRLKLPWTMEGKRDYNRTLDYWTALAHHYSAWYLARPSVVQIGPYLFTHAGLPRRFAYGRQGLDEMNAEVKATLEFFLLAHKAEDLRPYARNSSGNGLYAPDPNNPLWNYVMHRKRTRDEPEFGPPYSDREIEQSLETLGVSHLFIGHISEPQPRIQFDDRVYFMDSGNSYAYQKYRPSSARIHDGKITLHQHKRSLRISRWLLFWRLGLFTKWPSPCTPLLESKVP